MKRVADPLLTSDYWRKTVRGHWLAKRLPCTRCGRAIDYDGPRLVVVRGRRKVNPRSLVVGHKVGRHEARRRGWTDAQINALSNTQPECAKCSASSGASYGNRLRQPKKPTTEVTTLKWWEPMSRRMTGRPSRLATADG